MQLQEDIAPYTPNIIAVTKYFDKEAIIQAFDAGLRDFGESRVIEAVQKINELPENVRENSNFHFIGHLQTNKVSKVVQNFDFIHSVDSSKLAEIISEEALKIGKRQKVLLQLNNANEEQKFGFSKEELLGYFGQMDSLKGIEIVGLMNMAPLLDDNKILEKLFSDVVKTRDELNQKFNCDLKEISMGMSGDYKEAVVAGATMIRIGRKLFSTVR